MKRTLEVEIEWIEGDESGGEVALRQRQAFPPGDDMPSGGLAKA